MLASVNQFGSELAAITARTDVSPSEQNIMIDRIRREKEERERIIWNTHVSELAAAGCSRGQSYE